MKRFLPPALRNPTRLEDYILSTFMEDWDYLKSAHLFFTYINPYLL
ncbi:hypothetical protein [Mucilaginibacter psychrotolerans]|nr:hypothetical protein [Mucilaginibacter psychrotolerans]